MSNPGQTQPTQRRGRPRETWGPVKQQQIHGSQQTLAGANCRALLCWALHRFSSGPTWGHGGALTAPRAEAQRESSLPPSRVRPAPQPPGLQGQDSQGQPGRLSQEEHPRARLVPHLPPLSPPPPQVPGLLDFPVALLRLRGSHPCGSAQHLVGTKGSRNLLGMGVGVPKPSLRRPSLKLLSPTQPWAADRKGEHCGPGQ